MSQTILSDANEEVVADAATASLLSPPNNNSISENSARMKCYYHHKQNHLLAYFEEPVPNGAAIYASDMSLQYSERDGKYTEFIGSPTGTIFVSAKRDHNVFY